MKNMIKEYLDISDSDKTSLWDNAVFVFDTNILLNLYRYSALTREALFKSLQSLKKRIWIPHQVAIEFAQNRHKVIYENIAKYDDIRELFEKSTSDIKQKLYLKDENNELENIRGSCANWINTYQEQNLLVTNPHEDKVLEQLLALFDGKVGKPFTNEELEVLYKEAATRFEKKIPPGFKDNAKQEDRSYGDCILWKEIIAFSKENNTDIIFITGDLKEDWWYRINGKTIGPLPALRKELFDKSGNQFYMYTMEQFLKQIANVTQKVIDEVDNVNDALAEQYQFVTSNKYKKLWSSRIHNYGKMDRSQEDFVRFILNNMDAKDIIRLMDIINKKDPKRLDDKNIITFIEFMKKHPELLKELLNNDTRKKTNDEDDKLSAYVV